MAIHPRNNRTPSGEKRRWSAEDRARRTDRQGRPAQPSAREQRRAEQFGEPRPERRDGRDDRRVDWYPGPRTKPHRPGGAEGERRARPERAGSGRFAEPRRQSPPDAPARGDRRERPAYDRPSYDRPSYDRTQPRDQRSERPTRDRQE